MAKNKLKYIFIPVFVAVCVLVYAIFVPVSIEKYTWKLLTAQQVNAPYFVVAHGNGYDVSDNEIFKFSKETDITCNVENGKITFTDKTNGKIYEGTCKLTSHVRHRSNVYSVVVDGKEGTATLAYRFINTKDDRILTVVFDEYILTFTAQ